AAESDILNLRSQGSGLHPEADSASQLALLGGGFASTVSGSVASVVTFGADGLGRFAFSADAAATMTGLGLTSQGGTVVFSVEPLTGALVGYVDGTIFGSPTPGFQPLIDRPVMSVELDANGNFVFRLYDQLDHVKAEGGNGANTELSTKAGGVLSGLDLGRIVEAFDGDGDKVRLDGKLVITVKDDVPTASITATGNVVVHDETAGRQSNESSLSEQQSVKNLFAVLGAGTALGYGRADIVNTSVTGGSDDTVTQTIKLEIVPADGATGLSSTTGGAITLVMGVNGIVKGVDASGALVFALHIDSDGRVSVAQYKAIEHPNTSSSNDFVDLGDLVKAVVTVKDYDGDTDTKSISIGKAIQFYDDGPVAQDGGTRDLVEDAKADGSFIASQVTGNLPFTAGADGATVTAVSYRLGTTIMEVAESGPPADPESFPAFMSNGVAVTVTSSVDAVTKVITVTGVANGNPVFTFTVQPSGSYVFELKGPIDHPDVGETGAADKLRLVFDFTVKDGDGDTSTNSIRIDIADDAPTTPALSGKAYLNESDIATTSVATGVMKFDGGGDGAKIVSLSYSPMTSGGVAQIYDADAGGPTVTRIGLTSNGQPIQVSEVAGISGPTLVGMANGQKVFEVVVTNVRTGAYEVRLLGPIDHPDKGETGSDDPLLMRIDFTVRDGDGDTANGHIQVYINDDGPVAQDGGTRDLVEDAKADGSFIASQVTGNLPFTAGADGATVTAVSYRLGTTIMEVAESGPPADPESFPAFMSNGVAVTVTSSVDAVTKVITVTGVANGNPVFTFTVQPSGSYVFELKGPIDHPDVGETGAADKLRLVFDFTVKDGDGDTSTNSIRIDIADDAPTTPALSGKAYLNESDIATTSVATGVMKFDGGGDGAKIVSLSYSPMTSGGVAQIYDADAGGPTVTRIGLTSNGQPIQVSEVAGISGPTLVGMANGQKVFEVVVTNVRTGAYEVRLLGPIDHPDKGETGSDDPLLMRIDFTVRDGDGDTANGHIQVYINDDGPVAVSEVPVVIAEDSAQTGGNLLTNDTLGADGATLSKVIFADGTTVKLADVAPDAGVYKFVRAEGEFTFRLDGTWTFKPAANFNGNASFQYAVTDGDGDESKAAAASITVTPVADAPVLAVANATVSYTEPDGVNMAELGSAYRLFAASNFTLSDADGTTGYGSVTLTANDGNDRLYLTLADQTALGVSLNNGTAAYTNSEQAKATLTITKAGGGNLTDAQLVEVLKHVIFHTDETTAASEIHKVSITAVDQTGLSSTPLEMTVTVSGTNDTPTWKNAVVSTSTLEDVGFALHEKFVDTQVTPEDRDSDGNVQVTLTATHGVLNIVLIPGVTIVAGASGTNTVTLLGSLEAVDDILIGPDSSTSGVRFVPEANYNGPATITLTVNDLGDQGLAAKSASSVINIDVVAVNDPAVIGGDTAGSIYEDATPNTISGTLTADDVDNDDNVFQVATGNGAYGSWKIGANGQWTYTLDNSKPAVDALNNGDKLTDTFTVYSQDGTSRLVTVTIHGVTDAPPVPDPVNANIYSNIMSDALQIPVEALLHKNGIGPNDGVTVQIISGAVLNGGIIQYSGGASGSFSYRLVAGTEVSDPAVVSIARVNTSFTGTNGDDFYIVRNWGQTDKGDNGKDIIITMGNTIYGDNSDDYLQGLGGDNTLYGGNGNDILIGGLSNVSNHLYGGNGDDILRTGSGGGNSYLDGESGRDLIDFSALTQSVNFTLVQSAVQQHFAHGTHTTHYANMEGVIGTNFNDTLTGSSSKDVLIGGRGDDKLIGGGDSDILTGGDGKDTFVLDPSALTGLNAADLITDYNLAEGDQVDLSKLFANDSALLNSVMADPEGKLDLQYNAATQQTGLTLAGHTDPIALFSGQVTTIKVLFDDTHNSQIS
ncbi:DUF5801 repeats-in-toxin domain-containing protein, partial [Shinella sp. G-2]|uniref:T1SS-143 repeat domain-containing protein n=1 Tax=Shinella sp. G-2 TaxID=3133141 RepID=UPI003D018198